MLARGQNLQNFHSANHCAQAGFNIVELMVTVAILGVLASLAGPNFSESIKRYRVNALRDDLVSSIQFARSEAIRRGARVSVARTTGCAWVVVPGDDDWSCGWEVFLDRNANGVRNTNTDTTLDDTLLQQSVVPAGYGVMHPGRGASLTANVWGQLPGGWQRFVLTPPSGVSSPATSTVCINSGGRVRTLKDEVVCPAN